jgi:hypothetical protein
MRRQTFSTTNRLSAITLTCILALYSFMAPAAWAGPPFITDDPEPVEYLHGELYIASLYSDNKDGKLATLPHFEFNYGAIPDVQLHLLVPFGHVRPNGGPTTYGLADTEVGVMYRFLRMSENTPQMAVFPLMHIPTGDADRSLGTGHVQLLLPIWIGKSWGPWTTYGGGGYWINAGQGNRNFYQLGWVVQRNLSDSLAVGGEIFSFGKTTEDGSSRLGYTAGCIFNLSEDHHLLFSAGSDISGDNRFFLFLAWELTFEPTK